MAAGVPRCAEAGSATVAAAGDRDGLSAGSVALGPGARRAFSKIRIQGLGSLLRSPEVQLICTLPGTPAPDAASAP